MSHYMTRQRRAMLNYLDGHPDRLVSAQEIAAALQDVSLSAVYRNLAALEEDGQVLRGVRDGVVCYRYAAESCRGRLHLSCRKCGRTFHMDGAGAAELVKAVERTEGFTIDQSETVLYGVCGDCRTAEKAQE